MGKAIKKIESSNQELEIGFYEMKKKKEIMPNHLKEIEYSIFNKKTNLKLLESKLAYFKQQLTKIEDSRPINRDSPFYQALKDYPIKK